MTASAPSPDPFVFHQRAHPSANCIVLIGERTATLVDTGFLGAYRETRRIVAGSLGPDRTLSSVLLTHWHSDHSGCAGLLQRRLGAVVHAHATEAALVNARHPGACDAAWLQHPVAPFCVDESLDQGSMVDAGRVRLRTIHVPGQTPGHVAFFDDDNRVLLAGDMIQRDDVAWLPPLDGRLSHLHEAIASLEALRGLGARIVLPGHGGVIRDPERAIDAALTRYHRWLREPELAAWHALNRLCVSALMIVPLPGDGLPVRLARLPWLRDYARALQEEPVRLARTLLDRLESGGAVRRHGAHLHAGVPFARPDRPHLPAAPDHWPACRPPPYRVRVGEVTQSG